MNISDPHCYIINSSAIGDIIASLPVLKYSINNFHKDEKYAVVAPNEFKDLFFFIPDKKFGSIFEKFTFDEPYGMSKLNIIETKIYQFHQMTKKGAEISEYNIQRVTPLRLHLTQYASINLLGKLIDLGENPIPRFPKDKLNNIDINKFNIDFSKVVLISTIYRASNRKWDHDEFYKLVKSIKSLNLIPVFIGKTKIDIDPKTPYYKDINLDLSEGIDLIDKTSLKELIKIMYSSKAIIGLDNGLLWLASMTDIPIIGGYNIVHPDLRKPYRENSFWFPIIPENIECKFCQSSWNLNNHDFSYCYLKHNNCLKELTSEKFIKSLTLLLD